MKFSVDSRVLAKALANVGKVIHSRNTLEILDCYLFRIIGGRLSVLASNDETEAEIFVPMLSCDSDGGFAINSKWLLSLLKKIDRESVTLSMGVNVLTVTTNRGQYSMACREESDYPRRKTGLADNFTAMRLPVADMLARFRNTSFCAATDVIRPVLMGVCMDVSPESVTYVATDTRRLAIFVDSRRKNVNIEPCRILLSSATTAVIANILDEGDISDIRFDGRMVEFRTPAARVQSVCLSGVYPDYNRVIPANDSTICVVERESMLAAMSRIDVCCSQVNSLVKLAVTFQGLSITCVNADMGMRAEESLACDVEGPELEIGLNGDFAMSILGTLTGNKVRMSFSSPSRPIVFRPESQPDDTEMLVIQMPMQLM